MRVTIVGNGGLAETITRLAERAGNTVLRPEEHATADTCFPADLLILTGPTSVIESMLANGALAIGEDAVLVDATIPTADGDGAALRAARVVRAFASVPADALASVLTVPSPPSARLAIPLAGDDGEAKALVAQFIKDLGFEPFDIGALSTAYVLAPGGALWAKALTSVELLEAVGWLSGDG